jgi:hypothetical protein
MPLKAAGIDTVLIGAHAANRFRVEVRHTVDIDFLVSDLRGAAEIFESYGYKVRVMGEDAVPNMLSARRGSTVVDLPLAEMLHQSDALWSAGSLATPPQPQFGVQFCRRNEFGSCITSLVHVSPA